MVDVGTVYDGSPFYPPVGLARMEKVGGYLTFSAYSGLTSPAYRDTSTRDRDPSGMVRGGPLRSGDESGPVFWPSVGDAAKPDAIRESIGEKLAFRFMGRTNYKGRTTLIDGMFNTRDKLARIGVVVSISGTPLANTDVILNGLEHREIVKTDHRGIWWKYLEIDEYLGALFISPNGIAYDLLKQIEREDNEGIFDQMVQRRTIANTGSRQLHRKFV